MENDKIPPDFFFQFFCPITPLKRYENRRHQPIIVLSFLLDRASDVLGFFFPTVVCETMQKKTWMSLSHVPWSLDLVTSRSSLLFSFFFPSLLGPFSLPEPKHLTSIHQLFTSPSYVNKTKQNPYNPSDFIIITPFTLSPTGSQCIKHLSVYILGRGRKEEKEKRNKYIMNSYNVPNVHHFKFFQLI